MEPLTTALLTAFAAAADAILGGALDAAGGDAWAATKEHLQRWAGLDQQQSQHHAFARAIQTAVSTLRRTWHDQRQLDAAFAVLPLTSPEAQGFVQAAVEELLLSATPDLGRLLDLYRREVRFTAELRQQSLPDWEAIRPVLTAFLGQALPEALRKEPALRPLVLEQTQLHLLDELRDLAQKQIAMSQRIAPMLEEMLLQPRIVQASVTAGAGSHITNAPISILLGDYRALPVNNQPDLAALYARYCAYVRGEYALLDFRGILQLRNVTKLPLAVIYVPLHGTARSPSQRLAGEPEREVSCETEFMQRTYSSPTQVVARPPGGWKPRATFTKAAYAA